MMVTRLLHLGHLICLKAWMFSCLGRYMMLSTRVTKRDSSPVHSHEEHVYNGFTLFFLSLKRPRVRNLSASEGLTLTRLGRTLAPSKVYLIPGLNPRGFLPIH